MRGRLQKGREGRLLYCTVTYIVFLNVPFASVACTESRCLPGVIEIDLLMLDPEAVPTFTRSRKIVDPEIVVLLTALAVTVTGEVRPVASSVGVEIVTMRVPEEV